MFANAEGDARHPFDEASAVTPGADGRLTGRTSDDYFAFVGPFGGITAATMLRALVEHPQRAGDPLAFTVNYCAPIARGEFELVTRLVKTNRSTQHWSVELRQDANVAAFATAVFAQRRPTWSHHPSSPPKVPAFERTPVYPHTAAAPWIGQFEFRFAEGEPRFGAVEFTEPASALSKLWISNIQPRPIDALSLSAIADAFFARIFHVRGELVPFGTVSMTTYFHADAADFSAENTTAVMGVADANIFHNSYCDQVGELWSPSGRLLATTHQIDYFKV